MTIHVNIAEAKARLSALVEASLRGEEVILAKAGQPKVRLVALPEAAKKSRDERRRKLDGILARMDAIPKLAGPGELEWDENGLPL